MISPHVASIRERCYEVVMQAGAITIRKVVAHVSKHISATTAASYGRSAINSQNKYAAKTRRKNGGFRKLTTERVIDCGKYRIVKEALQELTRKEKLVRVSVGVYGVPTPKLFTGDEAATA